MAFRKEIKIEWPREISSRAPARLTRYELSPDLYALHNRGERPSSDDDVVDVLNDGDHTIDVIRGPLDAPRSASAEGEVGPVYLLQPAGSMAVPTGLVFISFVDGVAAADRRLEIERAGYAIERGLDYAPQAAWLKPQSGGVEGALKNLARLEQIADLVTVEPQMLFKKSAR